MLTHLTNRDAWSVLSCLCVFIALLVGCSPRDPDVITSVLGDSEWPRHVITSGYNNFTAVAADFTGDGLPDVISSGNGKIRLYVAPNWTEVAIRTTEPFCSWPWPLSRPLIHSEVMDVDDDGDPDFIGAVYMPGSIFWLERPDNPIEDLWPFHIVDNTVNGTHGLIVGDIDGDNRPDLAGNSAQPSDTPYPESLLWWKIPPEPRQAAHWKRHVFADGDAPGLSHYLGLGDVNGDGMTDAVSAAKVLPGGNWFAWWEQPIDGSLPWKKHMLATEQEGATNILPAEVNGDGRMDFIATRGHGKGVLWFEAPDFTLHEIDPDLAGPHSLSVGDIDQDGDVDAVSCGKDNFTAAWFENDGHGNFRTHIIGTGQSSYDIRLIDMDVDGDLDVLIAGENSENVVWYENRTLN